MKRCVGCKNQLRDSAFYPAKTSEDGLNRYCKQCCKVNRSLEGVRKRDKKSKMSYRQLHRARGLNVAADDTITLVEVFRVHRGICAICNQWVQPRHASMDHTYPLSLGGTHTWDNVQLTHLKCNLRKGANI